MIRTIVSRNFVVEQYPHSILHFLLTVGVPSYSEAILILKLVSDSIRQLILTTKQLSIQQFYFFHFCF